MRHTRLNIRFNKIDEFGNFQFVNPNSVKRFTLAELYLNFNRVFIHKPLLNNFVLFKIKTIGAKGYLSRIWVAVKRTVVLIPDCKSKIVNFIKNISRNNFFIGIESFVNLSKKWMRNRMIKVKHSLVWSFVTRGFGLLKDTIGNGFFPVKIFAIFTANRKSISFGGFYKATVAQERTINNLFGSVIKFFGIIFSGEKIRLVCESGFLVSEKFVLALLGAIQSLTIYKNFVTYFARLHKSLLYIYKVVLSSKILNDYMPTFLWEDDIVCSA